MTYYFHDQVQESDSNLREGSPLSLCSALGAALVVSIAALQFSCSILKVAFSTFFTTLCLSPLHAHVWYCGASGLICQFDLSGLAT